MNTFTSRLILTIAGIAAFGVTAIAQFATFNGHTYTRISATSITDARAQAEAMFGKLATITSQAENDFIYQTFVAGNSGSPFIGFSDELVEGSFAWDSGEDVRYTNWRAGEPNDGGGNEDYTVIRQADGEWNDANGTPGNGRDAIVEIVPFRVVSSVQPYFEDFELNGQAGWSSDDGVWQLGTPSAPGDPVPSGVNAWATNLTGDYPDGVDVSVTSPRFLIDQYVSSLIFSFELAVELEECCDAVRLEMSVDGGPFGVVGSVADRSWYTNTTGGPEQLEGWSGSHHPYRRYIRRLDGATPGGAIRLRVRLFTNGSVAAAGAAFDDVKLESIGQLGTETTSGDDITQIVSINGRPDHLHERLSNSELVSVRTLSPNGTLDGQPLLILAELFVGAPPAGPLPGIYLTGDPATTVIVAGGVASPFGAPLAVTPEGHVFSFISPGLPGTVNMTLQAIVPAPMPLTENGIYASSDAHRFRF